MDFKNIAVEQTNINRNGIPTALYTALSAIEITSIPHISVIDEDADEKSAVEQYQYDMEALLSELAQSTKDSREAGLIQDTAYEILWKTEKVENQPYKAKIRLFLIIRACGTVRANAVSSVDSSLRLCLSILYLHKYDFEELSAEDFSSIYLCTKSPCMKAIVKRDRVEESRNNIIPLCYTYDVLPRNFSDMSKLISILTEYPDCAVSFQLIPDVFLPDERQSIISTAQALDVVSHGVADRGLGNVSNSLIENSASAYKYYYMKKDAAVFRYNIFIFGSDIAAANIATRVYGQLSVGEEGSCPMNILPLRDSARRFDADSFTMPWRVAEYLLSNFRDMRSMQSAQAAFRLPYKISFEEAGELFKLPIGSSNISAGLTVNESGKQRKTYRDGIINSGDITVGTLRASGKDTIGFDYPDLAKHMLVVGTPGSGKTTFSVSLLDRLWHSVPRIPFLVIEPAKNEYRALIERIPDMQVFTPGKSEVSRFLYNPFIPPKNVRLEQYKSTLKTAFSAAVDMSTPLDKIFEDAIHNCYSDFKWFDTYTSDDGGEIFNMADFAKCFQTTFEKIGYTGEARNIGRAGIVRMKSLVYLFDNYFSIPIEDLLSKPTVIELSAIENPEEKALIIALLLLAILSYVNANYVGTGGLRNVILLEEAHVLLGESSQKQENRANPSAIAQNLVKRMLAEIRSYGVGIIIADQSPRKVTTDVVALTDMKVVFRLVEGEDKRIIADSTNMSEAQYDRMSKLRPGEAFFFFNKLDEPEEVTMSDYRGKKGISISISDKDLQQRSTYWKGRTEKLRPYPQCVLCPACRHNCSNSRRVFSKEIARRIHNKYFSSETVDKQQLSAFLQGFNGNVRAELGSVPMTKELAYCIKVHFWRNIIYGTKLRVAPSAVEASLMKTAETMNDD